MNPPLVSVIMANRNSGDFLPLAVGSILNQDFAQWELIVVDDASSDGSVPKLEAMVKNDARVRLFKNANKKGAAASRNLAVTHARSELIAIMDSDDIAMPGRLTRQFDFMRAHSEVLLLGSNVQLIDLASSVKRSSLDLPCEHREIDAALLMGCWPMIHPSTMMRTQIFREVGGYGENFIKQEDHDLFLRLAEKGKIQNLPEVLLAYRLGPNGLTYSLAGQNFLELAIRTACERRKIPFPPQLEIKKPGLSSQLGRQMMRQQMVRFAFSVSTKGHRARLGLWNAMRTKWRRLKQKLCK